MSVHKKIKQQQAKSRLQHDEKGTQVVIESERSETVCERPFLSV